MTDIETKFIHKNSYPKVARGAPEHILPMALFVQGEIPDRCVAVVGTREPSEFGIRACERIVQYAVEQGFGIVSGLARGIDRVAHETAIACGGKTVAVLAHGLPQTRSSGVYPSEHLKLYLDILDSGGAGVSEYDFGVPPSAENFLSRNRIQAMLSVGTIAVQSDFSGGTITTIQHTMSLGRPVWMPVPSPGSAFFEDPKCNVAKYLSEKTFNELASEMCSPRCPIRFSRGTANEIIRFNNGSEKVIMAIRSREDYLPMFFSMNKSFDRLSGESVPLEIDTVSKVTEAGIAPEETEDEVDFSDMSGREEPLSPKDKIAVITGRIKVNVFFDEELPPVPAIVSPQRSILASSPKPIKLTREESVALHAGEMTAEQVENVILGRSSSSDVPRDSLHVVGDEEENIIKERRLRAAEAAASNMKSDDPMIAHKPAKRNRSAKSESPLAPEALPSLTAPETPKRRGRPPGSKNKSTLEREAREAAARGDSADSQAESGAVLVALAKAPATGYHPAVPVPQDSVTCPACGVPYGSEGVAGCFICGR